MGSLSFSKLYAQKNDIKKTLKAFEETFEILSKIVKNNISIMTRIEGDLVSPVFRKVSDFNSFINKR